MFYNIKSGCSSFIFSRNTIFCNLYMTKMLRKFRKLLSAIIGIIICCPGRMITIACIGGNMMLSGIVGRYTQLPENYCLVRRSQLMSEVCMQYNWGVQYDNEGPFCKAELYYLWPSGVGRNRCRYESCLASSDHFFYVGVYVTLGKKTAYDVSNF